MRSSWCTCVVTLLLATSAAAQNDARPAAVLEEIIVTATRVETNLQQTPASVYALSGEELALAGIDQGRDLGIMVPNVAINPGPLGELGTAMVIRGLPGVTTYIDGIWVDNLGFLQRSLVEIERVEILRGPQGTLFGRNTNGGAIQIVTRKPADEFGARLDLEVGEFERRTLKLATDVPFGDRLRTKWTAALDESEGFMPSLSAPFALGDQDNSLLRADVLWQPTERFSLRFNVNREDRNGSPARIVRISNTASRDYIAYNVLAGNPDYLNQARAIDPGFPDPPLALAADRFTAESHEQGFPGGRVGRWQTRTDIAGPTVVDQRYAPLTLEWRITDHLSLESVSARVETESHQIHSLDGSELDFTTELVRSEVETTIQELHLFGEHFNGRLESMLGLYYQHFEAWTRTSSWWFWEFAVPNTGPSPPLPNQAAVSYVRAWGATVGNPAVAMYFPFTSETADRLFYNDDTDRAFFGQFKIGLLDRVDLTLGFRFTGDDGATAEYLPADAFRLPEPGTIPAGDPYATAAVIFATDRPDTGTASTPKLSISYEPMDDLYLYASYAEGFTSAQILNVGLPEPIKLDPEVVRTSEIGLRSDWLDNRLRLNATYFDSRWDGVRVPKRIDDPNNPGFFREVRSSDGSATASGLEAELSYVTGERWELNFALGLLDTEYVDIGDPPANGSGLQPGTPLPYASDTSYSIGVRHRLPLAGGGDLLFAGDYGWVDEYERAPTNQTQSRGPDGSRKPEPAYGVLNARIVYQPANPAWQVALFGTNLTNEWYVNGGFDARFTGGYDLGTIGRPREIGASVRFVID